MQVGAAEPFACDALAKSWRLFGVTFSPEVWSVFDGMREVRLFRCAACGFQFCDPKLAGNGAFYAELERQKTVYYPPEVPEFIRTLQWAQERHARTVLDIGCGDGAFLDLARGAGLTTMGMELNLQAAAECRRKGHAVHTGTIAELLEQPDAPRFDFVTMFQVLEHVPNPVGFLSEAARLLAVGGCLSVAVPNEDGIYRICPKEPHQWPPHHITRWRRRDLHAIGRMCGLQVIRVGANGLYGAEIEHFWKLRNRIGAVLGEKALPGGDRLPQLLSLIYRKLGLRYILPSLGTSVYALYQRPAS